MDRETAARICKEFFERDRQAKKNSKRNILASVPVYNNDPYIGSLEEELDNQEFLDAEER